MAPADDLHQFKQLTLGQLTVMGRTTYEGLPKRPLPGRTNIVLTHQEDYQAPGAVVVHDAQSCSPMLRLTRSSA